MSGIELSVRPKPSYDPFEKVTISATLVGDAGDSGLSLRKDMDVDDATVFAKQILEACDAVRRDMVKVIVTPPAAEPVPDLMTELRRSLDRVRRAEL